MLKKILSLGFTLIFMVVYCATVSAAEYNAIGNSGAIFFQDLFDGDPNTAVNSNNYVLTTSGTDMTKWNNVIATSDTKGIGYMKYKTDGDRNFLAMTRDAEQPGITATNFALRLGKYIPEKINEVKPVYVIEFDFKPSTSGAIEMLFRGMTTDGGTTPKDFVIWNCNGPKATNYNNKYGYGLSTALTSLTSEEQSYLIQDVNEWHHTVIILDVPNMKVSTFVNGFATRHDFPLTGAYADTNGRFELRLNATLFNGGECAIDNYSISVAGDKKYIYDAELFSGSYTTAHRTDTLSDGTDFVTKSIINESSQPYNVSFITAVYESNKMTQVIIENQTVPAMYNYFFKKELNIENTDTKLKVFLWDGIGSAMPINTPKSFVR